VSGGGHGSSEVRDWDGEGPFHESSFTLGAVGGKRPTVGQGNTVTERLPEEKGKWWGGGGGGGVVGGGTVGRTKRRNGRHWPVGAQGEGAVAGGKRGLGGRAVVPTTA